MRIASILILISVLYSSGVIGKWNHYTSLLTPTDIIVQNNQYIYATTIGGLLELDLESSEFNYIKKNYLEYLDLTSLVDDADGNLVLGGNTPNGTIQIFHNDFGLRDNINHLYEIDNILKFELNYPFLFASYQSDATYGILKLEYMENDIPEYVDFYNNFPEQFTNITDIDVYNDSLFVTTPEGIFYGNHLTENLKSSDNWKSLSIPVELPMVFHPDSFVYFVGGYNQLWGKYDGTWEEVELEINTELSYDYQILEIVEIGSNSVGILTKKQYFQIENTESMSTELDFSIPVDTDFIAFDYFENTATAAFGMKHHGILILDVVSQDYEIYVPDSPIHNQYDAITVLNDGRLIGVCNRIEVNEYNICEPSDVKCSDPDADNYFPGADGCSDDPADFCCCEYNDEIGGVTIFENDQFINYVSSMSNSYWEYPVNENDYDYFTGIEIDYHLGDLDTWSVVESESGTILFSNNGIKPNQTGNRGGLIEINLFTGEAIVYDTTNGILDGQDGIHNGNSIIRYISINQINKDKIGNIWILNPMSERYNYLSVIQSSNGESWNHVFAPNELSYLPQEITFDNFNLVWFGFKNLKMGDIIYSEGGLKVLNTKGTFEYTLDDNWITVENPDRLPGGEKTSIWSLTTDNMNRIWVLTSDGVQGYIFSRSGNSIYLNPLYTDIEGELYNFLSFLNLNQGDRIRIDSQNNIWISTRNSGVWFIPEDTPPWEDQIQYSVDNSPILSDKVFDIAFDNNDGTVYFATEKGISSVRLPINTVKNNSDNLIKISPNPLRIPGHDFTDIYDLYPGSTVKIMKLSGRVVRKLQEDLLSQNDTAVRWDGRNSQGELVGSGIYLITASHPVGGNAVSKIAVIRQ